NLTARAAERQRMRGKQSTAPEISSRRKQLAGTIVCWCRFKTLAQLHSKTDINLGTEIESEKWVGRFTRGSAGDAVAGRRAVSARIAAALHFRNPLPRDARTRAPTRSHV